MLLHLFDMHTGSDSAVACKHMSGIVLTMDVVPSMRVQFGVPSCELLVSALPFASGGKDVSGRLEEPRKASLWSHHLLLLLNVFVTP